MTPDPPLAPFLRRDGLAAGLTKHQLDGPGYHRVFRSVRVPVVLALTPRVLARSASLVVPGAVISHHTAAQLWGGVVPDDPLVHLTVARPAGGRTRDGLDCHVSSSTRTAELGGLTVTTPTQTFVDLASHLPLVNLVVLGDSLVNRGRVTPAELLEAVDGEGVGSLARQAAELVREGVESPMETRLRLLLVLAGLPEPVVQRVVGDGRVRYRLDLSYPDVLLAVEYDGRQHADDAQQWGHDLGRREWLDGQGWRLVVVRATDIYATPWATVLRVGMVLAERGYLKTLPDVAPAAFPALPRTVLAPSRVTPDREVPATRRPTSARSRT